MKIPTKRKPSEHELDPRLKEGIIIEFNRRGKDLKGLVLSIRENTVMVQLDELTQKHLEIENERTIVHHKNYKIGG